MNDLADLEGSAITDAIDGVDLSTEKLIPIELYTRRNRKTTQLVNNHSPEIFQRGQNRWYELELKDPVFVTTIKVSVSDHSDYKECEFKWSGPGSDEGKAKITKHEDGLFSVAVCAFIKKFSFKPEKRYLGDPRITQVRLFGYTRQSFIDTAEDMYDVDVFKEKAINDTNAQLSILETAKEEIEELQSEIDTASEKHNQLILENENQKQEIKKLTEETSQKQEVITGLKSEESDIKSRLEVLDDSLDLKKKEQQGLNSEISSKSTQLRGLQDDINMFPTEISEFVNQSADSVKKYTWLALIPMFIIAVFTIALFLNAADLTLVYREGDIDVMSIFLTRLPFVFIAVTLIHASYKVAKIFIAEIMNINNQKLNLSKISIVATDVSNNSITGLDLSQEEIYHLRTQLRMELLREHLKNHVSKEYHYKGEKNGLFSHLVKKPEKFKAEEEDLDS